MKRTTLISWLVTGAAFWGITQLLPTPEAWRYIPVAVLVQVIAVCMSFEGTQ